MTINRFDFAENVARAEEALADGFSTKAQQKDALNFLSNAYFRLREVASQAALDANDDDAYWALPFELHQVREAKHAGFFGANWDRVATLVSLREIIKSEEINRVEVDNSQRELRQRVERTIAEEMDRIGKQYAAALDLGRVLKGLPVTANSHFVTNRFGTTFVRTIWFLNGKLTRFNVIAAAYEALVDEGTIVEEEGR